MFKLKRIVAKATRDNGSVFYVVPPWKTHENLTYELGDLYNAIDFRGHFCFVWKRDVKKGLEKRFPNHTIEFIKV